LLVLTYLQVTLPLPTAVFQLQRLQVCYWNAIVSNTTKFPTFKEDTHIKKTTFKNPDSLVAAAFPQRY
jgi:hypothetical protein